MSSPPDRNSNNVADGGTISLSSSSSSSSAVSLSSTLGVPKSGAALAGSGSSIREAAVGLMAGIAYGAVTPVVGHPFDSIKTRMQADPLFQNTGSAWQTSRFILQKEGIAGFYRGFFPPLIGSMAFRGVLFSAYSGTYAACEQISLLKEPIPFTFGLRPSVLLGGMAAAFARASIESPFDFIKVRYMVGQAALDNDAITTTTAATTTRRSFLQTALATTGNSNNPIAIVRQLYSGYSVTLLRCMGLVGSFFIMVDYSVRFLPTIMNAPLIGPFFKGGICATAAWLFCFPFETAKSLIQAEGKYKGMPTFQVLRLVYQERGIVRGLYRGFLPGASRSFFANGASMIVYSWFQDQVRQT